MLERTASGEPLLDAGRGRRQSNQPGGLRRPRPSFRRHLGQPRLGGGPQGRLRRGRRGRLRRLPAAGGQLRPDRYGGEGCRACRGCVVGCSVVREPRDRSRRSARTRPGGHTRGNPRTARRRQRRCRGIGVHRGRLRDPHLAGHRGASGGHRPHRGPTRLRRRRAAAAAGAEGGGPGRGAGQRRGPRRRRVVHSACRRQGDSGGLGTASELSQSFQPVDDDPIRRRRYAVGACASGDIRRARPENPHAPRR